MQFRYSLFPTLLLVTFGLSRNFVTPLYAASDLFSVDLNTAIFTSDNVDLLCRPDGKRRIVDRIQLAEALAGVAKVKFELRDKANPLGTADGKISDSEKLRYISSDAPFGDDVASYDEAEKAALRKQYALRAALDEWFLIGPKSSSRFKVDPPNPTVDQYFAPNSPHEIVCRSPSDATSPGQPKPDQQQATTSSLPDTLDKMVVVRKSVADLKVSKSKLTKANGATVSLVQDREGGKNSYSIEGVVGILLAGSLSDKVEKMQGTALSASRGVEAPQPWRSFNATPYVFYKRYEQQPRSTKQPNIDYVQPGISADITWISASGDFAFDLQGDGNYVLDSENDARYWTTKIVFAPSFINDGRVIFGAPLVFGPFAIRPTIDGVIGVFVIEDAGTNKDLLNKQTFASLGFDAAADVFLVSTSSILTNFKLSAIYNYRYNTDSVPENSTFMGLLSYSPPGQENVSVDLTYVNGRDLNTFQKQDKVSASLAFRY